MLALDLRIWRKNHGYTQETASKILCVTVGHYRKWEYGLAPIPRHVGALITALAALGGLA